MKTIVSPLIYNQVSYSDYGIDPHTGHVYSKKTGYWKPMSWSVGGNMKYPQASLSQNGLKKVISFHIAACETLKEIPIPPGVTAAEWKRTPNSVKRITRKIWQVNHIDHNHLNFHPDNLEWVTGEQNCHLYQQHRVVLEA
jgi:hypothetical protein